MPLTRSAAKRAQAAQESEGLPHRQDTAITISTSATGQGRARTRWLRPSASVKKELESKNSEKLSPLPSLFSDDDVDERFVTPAPRDSFDAGSVLWTPVRKLTRHPNRIGPDRIDFWHDKGSEFRAFITDGAKAAVPHTSASVGGFQLPHAMASREEHKESARGVRIERGSTGSRSGLGPEGTVLNFEELGSPFQSQDNVFSRRPRLGPEGTELLEVSELERNVRRKVSESTFRQGGRLGPHGTELID